MLKKCTTFSVGGEGAQMDGPSCTTTAVRTTAGGKMMKRESIQPVIMTPGNFVFQESLL
jgi:hypothetical protein